MIQRLEVGVYSNDSISAISEVSTDTIGELEDLSTQTVHNLMLRYLTSPF